MQPKVSILSAIAFGWIFAAVSCAALSFLHAVPQLKSPQDIGPLFFATIIGLAVSFALTVLIRRLCSAGPRDPNEWKSLGTGEAALVGVMSFGLPLGLLYSLSMFLYKSDFLWAVPYAILFPLVGVFNGIMMRRAALKSAPTDSGGTGN